MQQSQKACKHQTKTKFERELRKGRKRHARNCRRPQNAGDLDYLLRVRVSDAKDYDSFYQRLIAKISTSEISASFVMDDIKDTTALPLS